ncbi:MAG: hypothetical protein K8I30_23455 [Anaerolineae bacterium]|nr:hypothetical protein [Anaerolineae bacterium]
MFHIFVQNGGMLVAGIILGGVYAVSLLYSNCETWHLPFAPTAGISPISTDEQGRNREFRAAAASSRMVAACSQFGGTPQANRRTNGHKILNTAALLVFPADNVGDNLTNSSPTSP